MMLERGDRTVPLQFSRGRLTVGWSHLLSAAVDPNDDRPHNLMVLTARLPSTAVRRLPCNPSATAITSNVGPQEGSVKRSRDQMLACLKDRHAGGSCQ